jgi:hypothetical protein
MVAIFEQLPSLQVIFGFAFCAGLAEADNCLYTSFRTASKCALAPSAPLKTLGTTAVVFWSAVSALRRAISVGPSVRLVERCRGSCACRRHRRDGCSHVRDGPACNLAVGWLKAETYAFREPTPPLRIERDKGRAGGRERRKQVRSVFVLAAHVTLP